MKTGTIWIVMGALVVLAGCTGSTKYMSPDEASDIEMGTGLTSQDFRSIADKMAREMITLPYIQNANTPPKVAFVSVQNNSNDYIDGDMFLRKMRTQLMRFSAGKVVFLDRAIIDRIEEENRSKAHGERTSSGEKTVFGADFFLTGTIDEISKATNRGQTSYFRLSFRLTDAADSALVWEGEYEIKKHATTGWLYQ